MLVGFLEMINNSDQLFDGMRYSNIVMLAFGSFLCQVFRKRWIPVTDIFGCVV